MLHELTRKLTRVAVTRCSVPEPLLSLHKYARGVLLPFFIFNNSFRRYFDRSLGTACRFDLTRAKFEMVIGLRKTVSFELWDRNTCLTAVL